MSLTQVLSVWAQALTVVAAVAWGLVGLFRFNPVRRGMSAPLGIARFLYVVMGTAGAGTAALLAGPRLLAALGISGRAGMRGRRIQSIVGRTLPTIGGSTLSGREVLLPSDTLGKVTMLVLGFSYSASDQIERWISAFRERFGADHDVIFFEVAILPGVYRVASPMIDAGMKRGTPSEMHDRVVSVYGPVGDFREVLGASPRSDAWIYLLDRDGKVAFQYGGRFDRRKFGDLVSKAEGILRAREAALVGGRERRARAA